ncbi:hypothetical protein ACF0H5_009372 [Mactra antiquata]
MQSELKHLKPIPGSRKLHSVCSTGVDVELKVRALSCYCNGCLNESHCLNSEYVEPWEVKILQGLSSNKVQSKKGRKGSSSQTTTINNIIDDTIDGCYESNTFVAINFETKRVKIYYFAQIKCVEEDEVCVEYLNKKDNFYQFPDKPEELWQSSSDILCVLPQPDTIVSGSRVKLQFKIDEVIVKQLKGLKLQ